VAKTRAQRKAERRARQERAQREGGGGNGAAEAEAQHRTQVPESGDVAEVEAVLETGAQPEELGEHVQGSTELAEPEAPAPEAETAPEAPAPSRADVGAPERETRDDKRERREREKDQRRKARAKELRKEPAPQREERRRGAIVAFLVSCWAELKRVQWPDRETLIQASAVTLIFIAVAAAYLGALDAFFSWFVKLVL
jgi:preprotein translocase SecE subunit